MIAKLLTVFNVGRSGEEWRATEESGRKERDDDEDDNEEKKEEDEAIK